MNKKDRVKALSLSGQTVPLQSVYYYQMLDIIIICNKNKKVNSSK